MDHSAEWTTSSAKNLGKRRKTGQKPRASGPLCRVDHWLGQKPRKKAQNEAKAGSQWSTPSSGPLALPETGKKAQNGAKSRSQWSTLSSGPLARSESWERGAKRGKSWEPVDHSVEWTTSWAGKLGKRRKTGQKSRASGPLYRVVHWLPIFLK